ncbi:MAG: dihydrofolate reductase [Bacilli bacterium]|nr:dihydrofolate reductase [Bacilli bacterium]MDD3895501.1 dihydrofolate reductase [Bacilli bacterium]MDD4408169.1 dihydrofolate reductase [Bacilli bacterium]
MSNLIIIAAIGRNGELGKENDLIWRTKEDMQFFKEKTTNHYIVMGRKTFESLPKKLPNRIHIVLTKSNQSFPEDVICLNSIEEFLAYVKDIDDDVYIIGGAQIYKELMAYANMMYLTEFDEICNEADVFFPQIDQLLWDNEITHNYSESKPKYLRKLYTRK